MKIKTTSTKMLALLLAFYASEAKATITPSIGTSISILNINDSDFNYTSDKDQLQISSINTGFLASEDDTPFVFGLYTNRLIYNRPSVRTVKSKADGQIYTNKVKSKVDTALIGYRYKKYIPAVFISNADVEKSVHDGGQEIGFKSNNTILYGLNLTYLYNKDFNGSVAILAPNEDLDIDAGVVFSINYNFGSYD